MAQLNLVILSGNLTRNPEVVFIREKMSLCKGGIAVNRTWRDNRGEKKEDVMFIDFQIWGEYGATFAKWTKKGSAVLLEGYLHFETWETDGDRHSKHTLTVEKFQFLDNKKKEKTDER